jgi:hypothetical protein
MTAITSKNLVAFALCATVIASFFLAGCSRDEEPDTTAESPGQSAPPALPSRLSDPEYKARLDNNLANQNDLRKVQSRLVSQLRDKINCARETLGTDDEETLRAALENDLDFKSLQSRLNDVATAIRDEQRHAAEVVRQRILSDIEKSK